MAKREQKATESAGKTKTFPSDHFRQHQRIREQPVQGSFSVEHLRTESAADCPDNGRAS
ncbi:MAG: hypothetical protein K0Q83_605 [Deltaproteobacteria bacterium]|nr:hypothetical protein [Deltaproteobacteria bacterium]